MKKKEFNQYSEWLFDVLFKVEERIDISGYSVQDARVFGFLAERLMDVWLLTNEKEFVESNWIQLGDMQLVSKGINFLKRKFLKNTNKKTHF